MPVEIKSDKVTTVPDKLSFSLADNSASFEIYTYGIYPPLKTTCDD